MNHLLRSLLVLGLVVALPAALVAAEPLKLLQLKVVPEADLVPTEWRVLVEFDQPVEQAQLEKALDLTVNGQASTLLVREATEAERLKWNAQIRRTFVVTPAATVPVRAACRVSVKAGLRDLAALRTLASGRDVSFQVRGPALSLMKNLVTGGPQKGFRVLLLFDQDMKAETVRPFVKVRVDDKDVAAEVTAGTADDAALLGGAPSRVLAVKPGSMKSGAQGLLVLGQDLPDASGAYLFAQERQVSFRAATGLMLIKAEGETQGLSDASVRLTFNEDVDDDLVRDNVTVSPRLYVWASKVNGNQQGARVIVLHGSFKPGAEYRIKVSDKLKSVAGAPLLTARTVRVTLPPVKPSVSFVEENRVVELKSRQLVHVALVNVAEVAAEVVRVPAELVWQVRNTELTALASPSRKRPYVESLPWAPGVTDKLVKVLKGWADGTSALGFPGARTASSAGVTLEAERFFCNLDAVNSRAFSIPLAFRDKPTAGGTFIVRVGAGAVGAGTTDYKVFQVTNLGISVKRSEKQLLAWVTSLDTGTPVAGVRLYLEVKGFRYDLGATDASGVRLVDLTKPQRVYGTSPDGDEAEKTIDSLGDGVLLAVTDGDFAWVGTDQNRIELPAGVQVEEGDQGSDVRGYAFTDRGIYRPGDTVNFKAVLRTFKDGQPQVPSRSEYVGVLTGPRGDEAWRGLLTQTVFGSVSGAVEMKKFHPLGTYSLRVLEKNAETGKDGKAVVTCSYELQEFRPPRHKVQIEFKQGESTDDRFVDVSVKRAYVTATVKGLYYAGGPVRHGKVSWTVRYAGVETQVEGQPDFEFKSHLLRDAPLLETGESLLDEAGAQTVQIPVAPEVLSGTLGVEVTATVQDFDGRPATSTEKYKLRPKVLVGTAKHPLAADVGAAASLRALVLEADGARVESGLLDVEVMRKTYMSLRKRDATGNVRWESEEVFTRAFTAAVKIEQGTALFSFDFQNSGDYLVRFHYQAKDGLTYTASSAYSVQGYYGDGEEAEKAERTIALVPDKGTYATGETAKLQVRARRRAATYLMTVERDRVLEYKLVPLPEGKGTLEVPLGPDAAPNCFVSLLAPCERVQFPIYSTDADVFKPAALFGAVRIQVRPASKALALEILPSPADRDPRPGDQLEVTVKVRDGDGKAVDAELALCAVDEGILALTGFETPDLARLFAQTLLALGVETADLRDLLLAQSPFRQLANKPFSGGDGDGAEGAKVQERRDFNPLAFWAAALVTGDDGEVKVGFKLPDTVTAYRIYAVAVDRGARYGSNQVLKKVVKPFYLEPGLPRFLTRGDQVTFPVQLFNKTDRPGKASFKAEAPANVEVSCDTGPFDVGPYASVVVPVTAKARRVGPATFAFEARLDAESDRVSVTLPVNARLTLHDRAVAGRLEGAATVTAEVPPDLDDVPEDERDVVTARLTITDNPLVSLAPGLRWMLAYPYGCVEQTSSGVMSLAGLRSLVKDGHLPGITLEEVDKYLGPGVDRVLSMQLPSGAFGYWPGDTDPHPWGTVVAAQALLMAKEAGFGLPDARRDKIVEYLKGQADGYLKAEKLRATEAMALWWSAQAGTADPKLLAKLAERLERFTREARVVFLMALRAAKAMPDAEVGKKLAVLVGDQNAAPSRVDFDPWDFGSSTREMAFTLILAQDLKRTELCAELAQRLLGKMSPTGSWVSTHDTGWALLALGRYFGDAGRLKAPATVKVVLGGVTQEVVVQPGQPATVELDGKRLMTARTVELKGPAGQALHFVLAYRLPMTEAMRRTLSEGYAVTRSYKLAGDQQRALRVGDVVEVELNIEIGRDGEYLVLEDPLPAGLVAINSKLKTEPPLPDRSDDRECSWWEGGYGFVPQHVELRDDRVLAFRNYGWREAYKYSYFARAVVPGTFTAPSAKIQEMYRPTRVGFSKAEKLTIEPVKK